MNIIKLESKGNVNIKNEEKPKIRKSEPRGLNSEAVEIKADKLKIMNDRQELTMHLHNLKTILLHSNATPIRLHDGQCYTCGFCKEKYTVPADLKTHTLEAHNVEEKSKFMKSYPLSDFVVKLDITSLKCTICDKNIEGIDQLVNHLKDNHGIQIFTDINSRMVPFKFDTAVPTCVYCEKTFGNFRVAVQHMNVHYRNFTCDICSKTFIAYKCLQQHMSRHKAAKQKEPVTNLIKVKKLTSMPELKGLNLKDVTIKKISLAKTPKEIRKHLHNLSTILLYSNATPIRINDVAGYSCCFCKEKYPIPADLKAHTLEKHNDDDKINFMNGYSVRNFVIRMDITSLICTICGSSIDGIEHLTEHLNGHGKYMFTDIKKHIIPFKFDKEVLYCIHCSKIFDHFKIAFEHMSVHYANYVCDICYNPFITLDCMRKHRRKHEVKEFKCNICSKVFDTYYKKLYHQNNVHLGKGRKNKCPYCNEKFTTHLKKLEHLTKEHGFEQKTYKCNGCDRTFNVKMSLRLHMKRFHLLERRFDCRECDKKFFSNSELKYHKVKHSGNKIYECDVCSKSFGRKQTLREHLRIHADDRRFKCERCGQTFVQKCSWKSHMRTKHGEAV